MPALLAEAVRKRYGEIEALAGVDLRVEEGELVGLLGPNGAGKSTLMKIACGLVGGYQGRIEVAGAPAGSRDARAATGYLAELFRFPDWASADEVLELHQRLAASSGGPAERARLLALTGLADASGRRVAGMSKGMQQRLGIAQALIGDPPVVLLDEPTSALDPAGRRAVRAILEAERARGAGVLVNSHLLSEIELVCDRVVIISGGVVVREGSPSELTERTGLQIETASGTRHFEAAGPEEIADIVAGLVAAGERVYSVLPERASLEEVYLDVVERDEAG